MKSLKLISDFDKQKSE